MSPVYFSGSLYSVCLTFPFPTLLAIVSVCIPLTLHISLAPSVFASVSDSLLPIFISVCWCVYLCVSLPVTLYTFSDCLALCLLFLHLSLSLSVIPLLPSLFLLILHPSLSLSFPQSLLYLPLSPSPPLSLALSRALSSTHKHLLRFTTSTPPPPPPNLGNHT